MSFKTIFIVIVTVLITVMFMINFDEMTIKLFFGYEVITYKSVFLLALAIICFVAGYLGGRMRRKKRVKETVIVKERQPEPARKLNPEDEQYIREEKDRDSRV